MIGVRNFLLTSPTFNHHPHVAGYMQGVAINNIDL